MSATSAQALTGQQLSRQRLVQDICDRVAMFFDLNADWLFIVMAIALGLGLGAVMGSLLMMPWPSLPGYAPNLG